MMSGTKVKMRMTKKQGMECEMMSRAQVEDDDVRGMNNGNGWLLEAGAHTLFRS